MADHLFTPTSAQTSDAENLSYVFKKLLSGAFFIELVEVTAIRGAAPNLVVDVIPLVTRTDPSGATIQNSEIFNVPVFRLQRGASAVIMNPVPGDIGMIAICDRDNSIARANRKQSVPGSKRTHSKSDALYLGGFLNQAPTQYVEFADNKINIVAPNGVNITTPDMYVSGNIRAGGDITDNVGTQSASLKSLRDKYDQHKHQVQNVQSGSSTITSTSTDKPA
ncbi:phage baseplate protein [Salmonella enterica]|uniref:phage baseplate protein n=1 Tax=Salmonella enterica TaxID=28901 RepID=UPI000B8B2A3F|nr:phage baseplate protein [Salmonella enterica]OXM32292.1 phage baseplate protein [Salmonella enterica subsp. enterica serovar Weslaco]